MADKITFATNVPIECALKFPAGKLVQSNFGDPQYLFTTTDDRVFFVAEKVAEKIHALKLKPREPFEIIKAEVDGGGGRKWTEWRASKLAFLVGEQPDGTFALPKPALSAPAAAIPAATEPAPRKQPGAALVDEANVLVDAYAEVLARALTKYEGRVKPDEVRGLVISAYIQRAKLSGVA